MMVIYLVKIINVLIVVRWRLYCEVQCITTLRLFISSDKHLICSRDVNTLLWKSLFAATPKLVIGLEKANIKKSLN